MAEQKRTAIILSFFLATACAQEPTPPSTNGNKIVQHTPDAVAGRALFIDKGCVTCHAINGVGGKAAPPLDAQTEMDQPDPIEFAARMWRGAPAMVELQSLELGYTIWLEGEDITNLAAFAASATEQKKLKLADIPEELRDSFLNERFWEVEDWGEFLKQGQEGVGEPERVDPQQ